MQIEIPGHPGYYVYSDGVVCRFDQMKRMPVPAPLFIDDEDQVMIVMENPERPGTNRAHRLASIMALAMKQPREPYFIDGDHHNFSLSNLTFDSPDKPAKLRRDQLVKCPHCCVKSRCIEDFEEHMRKRHPRQWAQRVEKTGTPVEEPTAA